MTSDEIVQRRNLEQVHTFFKCERELNLEVWSAIWADNAIRRTPFAPPGFPRELQGKQAIVEALRGPFEQALRLTVQEEVFPTTDPRLVIARARTTGEMRNGATYRNEVVAFFRFDDENRIVEWVGYIDPLPILELMKTPTSTAPADNDEQLTEELAEVARQGQLVAEARTPAAAADGLRSRLSGALDATDITMSLPEIHHRTVVIDGVRVFYREAGPHDAPTLLLLHGFPSSSWQYRRLIDALGTRYRLIAPDYPGFGHSEAPAPRSAGGSYAYSFDQLARTMVGLCDALELQRYFLYMFDFGGPVGMRLAVSHPERVQGLVIQNANAYLEGLSPTARHFVALRPERPGALEEVQSLLTLEMTRSQYETGAQDVTRIAPDGWTLDQHFLDLPGRQAIQAELLLDYHSNVALYPQWQDWLRRHEPPALVLWGRGDPFFIEAGAHAYRRDLPQAELHIFDTGHFALEEEAPRMAALIADFMQRHSGAPAPR